MQDSNPVKWIQCQHVLIFGQNQRFTSV